MIRQFIIITLLLIPICLWSQEQVEAMVSKINTEVDQNYVYQYEQTKFVPPSGKTLLIMGQTVERINEYVETIPDQPLPGGWAAYWGIPEFSGVTYPKKNETGSTQHHQMIVDKFPNSVIQSAMWMVGKWEVAKKKQVKETMTM